MDKYLFDLFRGEGCAEISVDPAQPYLRDHDVGVPLFGTVLSLEAMSESVHLLLGKLPRLITGVTAGSDCLISRPKSLRCAVGAGAGPVHTVLTDGADLIFQADMDFLSPPAPPPQSSPVLLRTPADSSMIYRCFFHGPSLRVVACACPWNGCMTARFASALPPLTGDGRLNTLIPMRLIEFCLQTSGLLDAAFRQEMSVPLSIARIELYQPAHINGVWSLARYGAAGTDIRAYNDDGEPVLSVLGYRTKPMPYASPGFDALCAALSP